MKQAAQHVAMIRSAPRAAPRPPSAMAMLLALVVAPVAALLSLQVAPHGSQLVDGLVSASAWIGGVYMTLVHWLSLPLIFTGLTSAIAVLFRDGSLRNMAVRATLFALGTGLLGISIALAATHLFRPGEVVPGAAAELARASQQVVHATGSGAAVESGQLGGLLALIPENLSIIGSGQLYLPLLILAVALGVGSGLVGGRAAELVRSQVESSYRLLLIIAGHILRLAPLPVGCLLFRLVIKSDVQILSALFPYISVLLLAFTLQLTVVYFAAVWILADIRPFRFLMAIREAMLVAFGTSSSSAALAVSLPLARDRLHVPEPVARFVLTAGTCLNQCGSAMFLGVTVIFLAQFFGIALSLWQHVIVIASCGISALGTVGLPGASLSVVALTLGMIGVPVETIGLILGVDRLMDMCRSMLNVTGDLAMAAVLSPGDGSAIRD